MDDVQALQLRVLCSYWQRAPVADVVGLCEQLGGGRLSWDAQDWVLRHCVDAPLAAALPCPEYQG